MPGELRARLQMVERGIAAALGRGELHKAVELHLRCVDLLAELAAPHQLHVSLRNSLQFSLWRWIVSTSLPQPPS